MDENNQQKPFDITPPNAANSQAVTTAPKVIIKGDPMFTDVKPGAPAIVPKNQAMMSEPPASENTEKPELISNQEPNIAVNTNGNTIEPSAELVTETETQEVAEPKPESFESTDALPDDNDKRTAEVVDKMQQPRIFDTKEYFVPIHETTHSHGFVKGSIVAAVVTVVIMLAVVGVLAFVVTK
jgi:hypothetical protein